MAVGEQRVGRAGMEAVNLAIVVAVDRARTGRCRERIPLCPVQKEILTVIRPTGSRWNERRGSNLAPDVPDGPTRVLGDEQRGAHTIADVHSPTLREIDLQSAGTIFRLWINQACTTEERAGSLERGIIRTISTAL